MKRKNKRHDIETRPSYTHKHIQAFSFFFPKRLNLFLLWFVIAFQVPVSCVS